MANEKQIKGFIVSGSPKYISAKYLGDTEVTNDMISRLGNSAIDSVWVNDSGNIEIDSSRIGAEKLNLKAVDAIQIKPGDGEPLQLDCEQNVAPTNDPNEYSVKVCNGKIEDKKKRVVALKLNTAKLILDTQKANTDAEFDPEEFIVQFRNDKWNGGVLVGKTGPNYAKLKARAIDLRCHDHGGIALQIAGIDKNKFENKIKFESDRTTEIGTTRVYCKEGGKGLEFGTFNNEHTSLYTGDYRFKGDAIVYGVTRQAPVATSSGKIDYPTQADDFKDVIDAGTPRASWIDIISAATVCKRLDETVQAKVAEAIVSGEVIFEQKISENGDRSGQDSEIVYSFGNNVADPEKVPDFAAFKANYNSKHTPKSDEELLEMYNAFLAEGPSFEIRVKISELLGLVARVEALEARLAALEGGNN